MMREVGTVYVTGGAGGLGAAVVQAVAGAGGTAAVIDRDLPKPDVPHVQVDLAEWDAATAAVDALREQIGPPAAVVTAAGIDACGPITQIDPRDWQRVIAVNLLGTVAVVRACLPDLERVRGTVVTVSSTLGLRGADAATAYSSSKFAIRG